MPGLKVEIDLPAWREAFRDKQKPLIDAAVAALRETAENAVKEGRQNIAGSGRFRGKWLSGLQYRIEQADTSAPRAIIFHRFGIAGVFEHGATIQGRPLLWIPTSRRAPPPRRSGKKLVSANVRGTPVLFDANDRDRHRKPLYVGVPSVHIPRRWRITEIVKQHAEKIAALFFKYFKAD